MSRSFKLHRQINYSQPVNWRHPLNRGLISWLKALPKNASGIRFTDLCDRNHGTLVNGVTWGSPGGHGLNFDGTNDYVNCGSAAIIDDIVPWSWAFWLNPRPAVNTNSLFIASKGSASVDSKYVRCAGIGAWAIQVVSTRSTNAEARSDANVFSANAWYHIVATYDPTDGPRIYVNGVEVTYAVRTVGSGADEPDAAKELIIGATDTPSLYFDGWMEEFRHYNRALIADEIRYLYQEGYEHSDLLNYLSHQVRLHSSAAGTTITPDAGTIVYSGLTPTAAVTLNQFASPGVGSVVYAGLAPTVSVAQNQSITPGVGAVTYAGLAPSLAVTEHQYITPGVGAIVLSGLAPAVSLTANITITPAIGTVAYSGLAPDAITTNAGTVQPGTGTITYTGLAPSLSLTENQIITPDVGGIIYTGYSPDLVSSEEVTAVNNGWGAAKWREKHKKRPPTTREIIQQLKEKKEDFKYIPAPEPVSPVPFRAEVLKDIQDDREILRKIKMKSTIVLLMGP